MDEGRAGGGAGKVGGRGAGHENTFLDIPAATGPILLLLFFGSLTCIDLCTI